MSFIRGIFSVFKCALVALCLFLCGCSGQEEAQKRDSDTLIVGVCSDNPPFASVNVEGGDPVGVEIDLARMIAERMHKKLKIIDMSFESLIAAVQSEKVDIVMSGLEPTEERRQNVDFATHYYQNKLAAVFMKGDISLESKGNGAVNGVFIVPFDHKIGVQLGTTHADQLNKVKETYSNLWNSEIKTYNRINEMVQDLLNGRITVIILDIAVAHLIAQKHDNFAVVPFDVPGDSPRYFAPVLKKNSPIKEKIDEAIQKLSDEGKIDKIIDHWLHNDSMDLLRADADGPHAESVAVKDGAENVASASAASALTVDAGSTADKNRSKSK